MWVLIGPVFLKAVFFFFSCGAQIAKREMKALVSWYALKVILYLLSHWLRLAGFGFTLNEKEVLFIVAPWVRACNCIIVVLGEPGGSNGSSLSLQIHAYNLETNTWEEIATKPHEKVGESGISPVFPCKPESGQDA